MAKSSQSAGAAIRAVARHFSAQWQTGEGPPDAELTAGRRKVALDIARIEEQPSRARRGARPRLREDRVAQRVLRDLEGALSAHVPPKKTLIFTFGAPIKVPKKVVASLTGVLLTYLESGAEEVEEKRTILGNRIRFRVPSHGSRWAGKATGFVFTGDPLPGALGNAMGSLHHAIVAKAKAHRLEGPSRERWLLLLSDDWIADIKTYRRAYSEFSPPHRFGKILMLFGGRVELLSEG